jgi:hypothetical protein
MTTLREAAQQALEALEEVQNHMNTSDWFDMRAAALRAALAEPVQEPVAWIQSNHLQLAQRGPFSCRVEPTQRHPDFVPLYTHPPRREPLSDEELDRLWREPMSADWEHREYARAVEAAHGIKENT